MGNGLASEEWEVSSVNLTIFSNFFGKFRKNFPENFKNYFFRKIRNPSSHPNIFALKEALLDIQASTYIRIQTIRQGILAKRDPAVLKRVEVAKNAWQEVVRGERTLYKYLKRVGFLYFEEEK